MMFSKINVLAIIGLLGMAAAAPSSKAPSCITGGYGTFYDKTDCTGNPSEAYSLSNPGCVENQVGRHSIYLQAPCQGDGYFMVFSPDTTCSCQNGCKEVPIGGGGPNYCWSLEGDVAAQSFRFQQDACKPDNCPNSTA